MARCRVVPSGRRRRVEIKLRLIHCDTERQRTEIAANPRIASAKNSRSPCVNPGSFPSSSSSIIVRPPCKTKLDVANSTDFGTLGKSSLIKTEPRPTISLERASRPVGACGSWPTVSAPVSDPALIGRRPRPGRVNGNEVRRRKRIVCPRAPNGERGSR